MKTALLLMLVFAAAVLAQIPAKSVVNGLAIEVTDVPITLPSGVVEMRALASVCTEQKAAMIQVVMVSQNAANVTEGDVRYSLLPVKVGASYCVFAVGTTDRSRTNAVQATSSTTAEIFTTPTAPPTSENTAGRRR
jgi:hypothetical protein